MNRKKFFSYTCVILFSLIGVLTSCSVDQADTNGLEGLWNVKQTTDQSTSIGYDVRIERSKTDSSIFYIWNFMNLAGNVSTTKTQCRLVTKFIKGEIKTVQQVLYKTINDSTTIITRITSYNVCYTKLLRIVSSRFELFESFVDGSHFKIEHRKIVFQVQYVKKQCIYRFVRLI